MKIFNCLCLLYRFKKNREYNSPERLWSLLLWRYSNPAWMRSCAACSGWTCFGRGVGLDDLQRSLPTPTILWFFVSVWFEDWFSGMWCWRLLKIKPWTKVRSQFWSSSFVAEVAQSIRRPSSHIRWDDWLSGCHERGECCLAQLY